ncbi:MAG: hypothetical protein KDK91_13270 [Gammaproteobacteria bacterium]|nr:hypothetical protein [Gammaproteobacteria bacterium]
MAEKKKRARNPSDQDQIVAAVKPGEDEAIAVARTVLQPTVQAAVTLREFGQAHGELDLAGLIASLKEQTGAASKGELGRAEAMLAAQAHTLDAIFNNLARRACLNMGKHLNACETYLKLALRAQAQCRSNLETLAAMKQPRSVAFVGQANIANGHQQVNNAPSRAREIENEQTKLLEQIDGERLDARAASTTGEADPALEAVGTVNRATNR